MNMLPVASTRNSIPSGDQVNTHGSTATSTLNSNLVKIHFLQHACNSHRRSFEESVATWLTIGGKA
jgi:hypothetical protein